MLAPSCPYQQPRARRQASILAFPLLYALDSEQKVWILLDIGADINYAGRANEPGWWNGIGSVVGQVFARHPVNGRVEMRSRVFAQVQRVPVPRGAAFIVARYF